MASTAHIHIDESKLILCLGAKYEAYATSIGRQIRDASIAVFEARSVHGNEWRVSETTPPKYIASFRLNYYRKQKKVRISNVDPAWNMVEWGAHAGGNPRNFVLGYKPMTRGLLIVAGGHAG